MEKTILCIVVPCFNEEGVLNETTERLIAVMKDLIRSSKINERSFILFVDDGSGDRTWDLVRRLSRTSGMVRGLKLSRNFGHQNALLAGLLKAKGQADCVISIDADLQQDEGAIPEFIDKYNEGFDIVFGVRKDRRSDGAAKKATALVFYRLMNLMGVRMIRNHADYRLVSSKVLEALASYDEVNLFLRGIFPSLGFRSTQVVHDVRERFAGESKYSMRKMLSFALDGITSFSVMPMRIVAIVGVLVCFFSLGMSGYVLLAKLLGGAVMGWASTVLPIYFIGGIQLISLGVIGEYVGKIYMEAKRRPRFIVEEEV